MPTVTFEETWLDFDKFPYTLLTTTTDGGEHSGGRSNTDFDYFSDSPSVGDTFEFRLNEPFSGVKLQVGTPMNGSPSIVWEYKAAGSWYTLRVKNGDAITKSGTQIVKWTPPADWRASDGSASRPGYIVRMRLTDITGVTEGGANSGSKVQKLYHHFNITGTGAKISDVYSYDISTPYVMLSPTTPAASLTPIECPFKKSGIIGKIDVILNGCTVGAGDTVVLTGTDYDGNTINETIDVSGSGTNTYTTTKHFQDVTNVACNGFSDGTISLQTKRIGLILPGNKVRSSYFKYRLFASLIIGDDATTTDFTSLSESWDFMYIATRFCAYGENTTLTMGAYESSGEVHHAQQTCLIYFNDLAGSGTNNVAVYLPYYLLATEGATVYFYGTKFLAPDTYGRGVLVVARPTDTTVCVKDVDFDIRTGSGGLAFSSGKIQDADGLWVYRIYGERGLPNFTGTTARRIIFNNDINMRNDRSRAFTIRNSQIESLSNVNNLDPGRYLKFIDCENLTPNDITNAGGTVTQAGDGIYLQKSFNLRVIDVNGSPISGASVVMTDKNGNEVFSDTTDANGDISEQIVTWYKGSWTPGVREISWENFTPHTVTISKTGYKTKVIKYTMDRKREEVEVLENRREV